MKRILWIYIELLLASTLLLYATIVVYNQIGYWALLVGGLIFAVFYAAIFRGALCTLKEDGREASTNQPEHKGE